MNISVRAKHQLERMFHLCRSSPEYSALVACGTHNSTMRHRDMSSELLQEGEFLNHFTGLVRFPNGSMLLIDVVA